MTLDARKLVLVQKFLRLENEESISNLERIVDSIEQQENKSEGIPFSIATFNERIDQSELDFEEGRFKSHEEVLSKYQ